jgi:rhodanese-related sulfurtransferase
MRWIFKTHLLFTAMLILSFVFVTAYERWKDTWSGSLAFAPQARAHAVRAVAANPARETARIADRAFVVATDAREVDRGPQAESLRSLILVCPRGEAAEQTAQLLRDYGYFHVEIVPGAAAAEAEPRRRVSDRPSVLATIRLAPGCTEWRPFAM